MQPPDRAFGPLPRHRVTRRRGLNQVGACACSLVGSVACSGHIPSLFAGGLGAITILSDLQTGSPCPASDGTGSTESASTGCQANIAPDSPRAAATRVANPKGRI